MDAALVGAIFTGVIGLVTTVGGLLLNRQKQRVDSLFDLESEVIELRGKIEAALRHIYELREDMAAHGHELPPIPDELTRRRTRRRDAS